MMGFPEDMIGAIKIKDGLFIGDEFAAQVSSNVQTRSQLGLLSLLTDEACLTRILALLM